MIINLPTKRISVIRVTNISNSFTHKMTTETNLHRYGTKVHHCRPMYNTRDRYQNSEILSCEKHCLNETYIGCRLVLPRCDAFLFALRRKV